MPSFYGRFKVFVDECEAYKVSNEDKIKIGKNPSEIPHQSRMISVMPQGLNCDAEMHPIISKDINNNSDFGVILMGSDRVSIDILSYISKQISKELNRPVYFNSNDSKSDLTVFKPDGRSTSYDSDGNIGEMELLSDKERNDRTEIAYSGKKPKQ